MKPRARFGQLTESGSSFDIHTASGQPLMARGFLILNGDLEVQTLIRELEETAQELADFAKYDDGFEQFEVAHAVEDLNRKAAQFGAPIDKEPVMLTPREGLIQVGKLLTWARQEADVDSRRIDDVLESLKRLELQRVPKEWYTVNEVAELTGVKPYTIRQGCNLGRFPKGQFEKIRTEWRIKHEVIEYIRNYGLPPKPKG